LLKRWNIYITLIIRKAKLLEDIAMHGTFEDVGKYSSYPFMNYEDIND